jgi:hypothetical protein
VCFGEVLVVGVGEEAREMAEAVLVGGEFDAVVVREGVERTEFVGRKR